MELDKNKQFCATCRHWGGKRECDDVKCSVSSSARGACDKMNKIKIAQGACDYWKCM